jgi:peroxiredoxin
MELTKVEVGGYAPDFELPGIDGNVHHLGTYLQNNRAVVVVFLCNQCPYVQAYWDRLQAIQADYRDRGVALIGINANDESRNSGESFERMKEIARLRGMNFPYLRDKTQEVAKAFGAECTPEVFLLDREGVVRYAGGIDDNCNQPEAVQTHDLREAIAAVLGDGTMAGAAATRPAVGSSLKWQI